MYMSPLGENAILAFGVFGRFAYTVVAGDPELSPEISHKAELSDPPPPHESSENRFPLIGSKDSAVGQVRSDATVRITAPVEGLICITAPVVKSPVVAVRLAYRFPPLSNTRLASVVPMLATSVEGPATPPPGGNL